MLAEAAAAAGVQLWRGITGFHCRRNRDSDWRLIFGQGRSGELNSLSARVLIDATGRSASVARQLGANRVALDRLVGVAVLFRKIEISDQGYVMVETVPEGWWYSAPVPPLGIIAMLMTDSDVCGHIKASQPPQWSQLLAKAPATSARVADRDVMWGPRVCSALSQRLRRYRTDDRWLAVGDAALAVDPISGSGVVRALRNAEAAARTAMTLLAGESEETIEAYESACDQDFSAYSRERGQYYALEVRWTESAFWQRRAGTFD